MAAKVGVVVVLSRRNKLIVSGCYESYFFYPFLPAATYLFLPVSTRGSRQNETLTNKMRVDLPAGRKKRFPYLFMGPHRGRNFVHRMHLKWVPTFLANFLLIANSRVRMHVRCTVKTNMAGNPKISQNSEDGIFDGLTPWYFKMSPRRAPHSFTPTQ